MISTSIMRRNVAISLLFTLVFLFAGPAAAHTGFESSDPGDGAVLDAPVDEISLVFSGEAEPTENSSATNVGAGGGL